MTPDERAHATINAVRVQFPEAWMGGRQRAVLAQVITNEIRAAEARGAAQVWAEVQQHCHQLLSLSTRTLDPAAPGGLDMGGKKE